MALLQPLPAALEEAAMKLERTSMVSETQLSLLLKEEEREIYSLWVHSERSCVCFNVTKNYTEESILFAFVESCTKTGYHC